MHGRAAQAAAGKNVHIRPEAVRRQAGGRAGLRANTRSGVWYQVARAIDALQPELVILENVRGLLSAEADCTVEPCQGCLGGKPNKYPLRALGAVVADLADLRYVGR